MVLIDKNRSDAFADGMILNVRIQMTLNRSFLKAVSSEEQLLLNEAIMVAFLLQFFR